MLRKLLGVAGVSGLLIAAPLTAASAADMPVKAPPPAPAWSWTGWYIGINGGGAWGRTDTTVNTVNGAPGFFALSNIPAVNAVGSTSFANSGGLLGGQAGYLFQAGKLISGLEVGLDYFGVKGGASRTGIYPASPPGTPEFFTFNETVKTDGLLTVLGRVGFDEGVWYPYATGGLAVARVTYGSTFVDNMFAPGCSTCTDTIRQTRSGFAVGGGVEWAVSQHWLVRSEYLLVDLGAVSGTSPAFANPAFPTFTASFSNRATFDAEQIVRLALAYKF